VPPPDWIIVTATVEMFVTVRTFTTVPTCSLSIASTTVAVARGVLARAGGDVSITTPHTSGAPSASHRVLRPVIAQPPIDLKFVISPL
jgi:hypothetical protein